MGDARRRSVNGNGLLVPDSRLVAPNGAPLSGATAAAAVQAKHYGLVIAEQGAVVRQTAMPDPFIQLKVQPKGWKKAWAVLRGKYTLEVQVAGDEQAMKAVFGTDSMIRR